jgi:hypothetical protein
MKEEGRCIQGQDRCMQGETKTTRYMRHACRRDQEHEGEDGCMQGEGAHGRRRWEHLKAGRRMQRRAGNAGRERPHAGI